MFGETFVLNPMFTFFAVQPQLHFSTAANYENNLPSNIGLRPDGGLCTWGCGRHAVPLHHLPEDGRAGALMGVSQVAS